MRANAALMPPRPVTYAAAARRAPGQTRWSGEDSCVNDLKEPAPRPLGCPPDELASEKNDTGQCQPAVDADRHDARAQNDDRRNHREIVRTRVTTVCPAAPLRIEQACHCHPGQRSNPDGGSKRYGCKQSRKNGRLWNPPRDQARTWCANPIARVLDDIGGHDSLTRAARRRPRLTQFAKGASCSHYRIKEILMPAIINASASANV